MKIIVKVFLVLAVFFVTGCGIVEKKNDWQQLNLKGEVKSIQQQSFDYKIEYGLSVKNKTISKTNYRFDMNGNMVEYSRIDPSDNRFLEKQTYEYDFRTHNNRGKVAGHDYGTDGKIVSNFEYKHDDKGFITEYKSVFDSSGSLNNRSTYKYNSKKQLIQQLDYNSGDRLVSTHDLVYDKKGNLILKTRTNVDNVIVQENHYRYDKSGEILEKEAEFGLNKRIRFMKEYQYDDKKNVIEYKYYDEYEVHKYTHKIEYEYDDMFNWVKKIVKNGDEIVEHTERVYEYY
ncbi:MAG: hypothetical protein WC002_08520 [Candidatus Muiribacteriota bacterium]